jgi:hypothetical protein
LQGGIRPPSACGENIIRNITSLGRGVVLRLAILLGCGLAASVASATPVPTQGDFLTGWGPTGLNVIEDGTSNTILFTDTSQLTLCFRNVSVRGGSGQILPFIEAGDGSVRFISTRDPFNIHFGLVAPLQPIHQIADGTSNTIQIGEAQPDRFCLGDTNPLQQIGEAPPPDTVVFGDGSNFDVCVSNVRIGTIQDGLSNTIQFGEVVPQTCLGNVQVDVAVSEPAMLALLASTPLALLAAHRMRRSRRPRLA